MTSREINCAIEHRRRQTERLSANDAPEHGACQVLDGDQPQVEFKIGARPGALRIDHSHRRAVETQRPARIGADTGQYGMAPGAIQRIAPANDRDRHGDPVGGDRIESRNRGNIYSPLDSEAKDPEQWNGDDVGNRAD